MSKKDGFGRGWPARQGAMRLNLIFGFRLFLQYIHSTTSSQKWPEQRAKVVFLLTRKGENLLKTASCAIPHAVCPCFAISVLQRRCTQ